MTERITVTIFLFLSFEVMSAISQPMKRVTVIESIGTSMKSARIANDGRPAPLVSVHDISSGRNIISAKNQFRTARVNILLKSMVFGGMGIEIRSSLSFELYIIDWVEKTVPTKQRRKQISEASAGAVQETDGSGVATETVPNRIPRNTAA